MDFALPYTEEQERFRQEVRAWLDENALESMRQPLDPNDTTEEMRKFWAEKHIELGKKGWLYPTYSKEYGGGGLSVEHSVVLQEELANVDIPGIHDNSLDLPAIGHTDIQ